METVILDAKKSDNIKLCADIIKNGGVISFPTETVYGLGADALNEKAVDGIFSIKGRQKDNPLIIHIASLNEINPLIKEIPKTFKPLAEKFWPGPLTLIMKKSHIVPSNVTAGLDTVAIRIPEHPAALALIRAVGRPVAAPSANPSGRPSPTKASHVKSDINGKIQYILDGGDCKLGLESTVLDISDDIPRILRPGYVTYDEIKELLNLSKVTNEQKTTEAPKSPGVKYRHYSPKTPLTAVLGAPEKTAEYISAHANNQSAALMFDDYAISHPNIIRLGHSEDFETQASNLFDALRKADSLGASAIFAQVPAEDGLGLAVANRLKKAAGNNIIILY